MKSLYIGLICLLVFSALIVVELIRNDHLIKSASKQRIAELLTKYDGQFDLTDTDSFGDYYFLYHNKELGRTIQFKTVVSRKISVFPLFNSISSIQTTVSNDNY